MIVLQIEKKRAQMHLDTIFTMLDEATFTAYAGLGKVRTQVIRPGVAGELISPFMKLMRCMTSSLPDWDSILSAC